jgi:predicted bacteriocin transport accessory protein
MEDFKMKKCLKIVIPVVIIIVIALVACFFIFKGNDAKKFDKEYGVGEDNPFVYKDAEEVVEILKNGTGVVYMGFSDCQWCQAYVKILNETAKEKGMDEIYYLNIKNDREKNTKEYQEIVELLRGKLVYTDDGKEKVYVPYVAFVIDGKVIDYDSETSEIDDDITPDQYWNKEQKERLQVKLGTLMEMVAKGSTCTDCNN